jgi:hypothetical protein
LASWCRKKQHSDSDYTNVSKGAQAPFYFSNFPNRLWPERRNIERMTQSATTAKTLALEPHEVRSIAAENTMAMRNSFFIERVLYP